MSHKHLIAYAAVALLALLLLPPTAVFARQMLQMFTAADRQAAKDIAASELRSILDARRGFARSPNTISHPFEYPYLDCPKREFGKVPPQIDETLMRVFMIDANFRDDLAERAALVKRFSRVQLAALTACLEATVLAARCQASADEATRDARRSDDPRLSDSNRAQAYCAAMNAIGHNGDAK